MIDINVTGWVLDGRKVKGRYIGRTPVTGEVTSSRVKYGGAVEYFVNLDTPIEVCGMLTDHVLLDHTDVDEVLSN